MSAWSFGCSREGVYEYQYYSNRLQYKTLWMWENTSIYYKKGMSPSDYGNLSKRIIEEYEQNPKEVVNVNGNAIFQSDLDYIILYHYYNYSEAKQVLDR